MKYNPDELNELPLSDYEKGYLTAVYDTVVEDEAKEYHNKYPEENFWSRCNVDEREFDLCVYLSDEDDTTSDLVCLVYECHPEIDGMGNATGNYSTDTSLGYYLKEVK
jgi:hypothetical protein